MHMVRAPPKASAMNHSLEAASIPHHQQQQQRNPSPAVNAYLQHLQAKKTTGIVAGTDQRQTITSPTARRKVLFRQPRQLSPVGISASLGAFPENDMNMSPKNHVSTKTLPRSSPTNLPGTPQSGKQRHKSKGKKSKTTTKPPLCGNQKHPRSIISEATNSTYLSSDSDEDASTATATVHSDGTSSFQSGPSTSGVTSRRHRKCRTDDYASGSSPRNFPPDHHVNSDHALVPYQPTEPYSSYTHDSVTDDDAYATDNNGSNFYFTDQMQRHHRVRCDSYNTNHHGNEDTEEFSYSDEDEYYYNHQQHRNQQHDDDRSYGDNDEDNDTLAVDLDQLIEEASARWKVAVSETVQSTTTTAFVSQQIALSATTPFVSPFLQRQFSDIGRGPVAPFTGNEHFFPNGAGSNQDISFPDIAVSPSSSSSQLIHEQQNEIEALRAELQRHQQQLSQPPMSVVDPYPNQPHFAQQQPQPVHPIQVLTVATDHNSAVEDDLTVWSGYQSMSAPPPLQRRPDADVGSVAGEDNRIPPSQQQTSTSTNKGTRLPQPPRPPFAATQTIHLELLSIVTGITRSAIFTGTVTSKSLPTSDNFTTMANHSITGKGVLQLVETGDVYRGDIVHSEMHGYGTYTFGASDKQQVKVLRGRFEHNVFIGE